MLHKHIILHEVEMRKIFSIFLALVALPSIVSATDFNDTDQIYGWNGSAQFWQTWADHKTQLGALFYTEAEIDALLTQDLTTAGNPAFNSVHASGGNLAAANAQVVKKWLTGLPYVTDVTAVVHGGNVYICTSDHTAGATTEPGVGASWATVWSLWGVAIYEPLKGADDNYVTDVEKTAIGNLPANTTTELSGKVGTSGDETIAGIKTFSSSPVVPTPTTDYQASTKKYVDDSMAAAGAGDITGVTAGTGLTGGGDTGGVTLNLTDTVVTPGAYTSADITVDQQGRITAAANGSGGTDDQTAAEVNITDAGEYFTGITVEAALQEAAADILLNNAKVTMTYPGAGIPNSTGSAWGTSYTLDTDIITGVSASDDTVPSAKAVDAALDLKQNIADVVEIIAGTALTFDIDTLNHDNTAVTPAAYIAANITVDQQGHITAAANGASTFSATLFDDVSAEAWLTTLGMTANGQSLVAAANYASMRTLLDLEAGIDFAPYSKIPIKTNSKAADYTIGTDDANEAYGGTVYVTSAAVITAPEIAVEQNYCVTTIGDIAVSLDVNAVDHMILDGVTLADGDKATNTSKSGDTICCQYYSVDGQYCWSGTVLGGHWTDGN